MYNLNKLTDRQKYFSRDKKGKLTTKGLPNSWNNNYVQFVVKYLNCLEPLFDKAQEKSDFQFILTLLRFRGIQGPGQDPYENSIETIDALMDIEKKIKGRAKLNIFLWLYGHIVESSEPYEIIANLLHICAGETYRTFNYPYQKIRSGYRPQSPTEKINYLEKLSNEVKMPFVIEPIKEILDKDLRNAVFHSDYSAYDGEVFINKPQRIYSKDEILTLINKTLAYHEAMKNLIKLYTKSYNKPKIIKTTPGFSPAPNEKAQIIVRKNHGVIALKAALTKKQIKSGKISWLAGYCTSYEYKLIDKGHFLLPRNRVEFWNRILRRLPNFLYKRVVGPIETYFINR